MCYFSSNWNLEADQQAAERLGPTRQAQSGYTRPVFLHRLVGARIRPCRNHRSAQHQQDAQRHKQLSPMCF